MIMRLPDPCCFGQLTPRGGSDGEWVVDPERLAELVVAGARSFTATGKTRRHNIWVPFSIMTLCIVIASWFGHRATVVVARGNPVGVRDCPAAVNGNERRHEALDASLGSDGQ